MSVIKKAVADLKEIKNTVSKVANKEVIKESKKHLDNKLAKLFEGEEISNDETLENTPEVGAEVENQGGEHNVDFINSILNDVDIEALINADENSMPDTDTSSDETKLTTDNNETDMSEFNKGEEQEPISQDEIKTEVSNLEPAENDTNDTDDFLNNLSEEELNEILNEIENESSDELDVVLDNDDSDITDSELEEAIAALGSDDLDVDTDIENVEPQENEVSELNVKAVEAYAKYLIQHEGQDLVDSSNRINVESLGNKLVDKFTPQGDEQEYQIFDIAERIAGQLEKDGDEDLEEGTSRSWANAKSVNTKPSQYADYNEDKGHIRESFNKLKSLAEKLIVENTDLKKNNAESLKTLDNIRGKLYEATVLSHKTSHVNQLFLEHNLSKDDKIKVIRGFMSVDTIEGAKSCYGKMNETFSNLTKTLVKESVGEKITRTTILATDEINSKKLNEAANAQTQTNPLVEKWRKLI
jgi:hypothetical protein